jgi:hypothetical protein
MAHTFAHGRVARRLSLVAALALAATVVITPMTRAADRRDVPTVSLFVEVGSTDLNRVAGGDPVSPDLANRTPPLH